MTQTAQLPAVPSPDRAAAAFLILHIVAMFGAFMMLGPAFDFPEVLRYPAADRFALFAANQSVIRPTYWVLTMTGVTQILISVLLFHVAGSRRGAFATLALTFGTLAGLCQALGFGRWVILIPYLVEQAGLGQAGAGLLEGAFNHYSGMLVGEHLANIFWGIWLASMNVTLLRTTDISRGFCWFGLVMSPVLILLAGEQIGISGDILDPLVDFGFPLLAVWHLLLAVQLLQRRGGAHFQPLGRGWTVAGAALAAGMAAPALL